MHGRTCNLPNQKYIIGTRGSLLALTQCGQIKDQLEKLTGDSFELKVITTQGDLQTDKPLWQLDGKDFFTKELDTALLLGEVDLVVHSYKDLGSERPEGIGLASVTRRGFAQDILFVKKETLLNINNKEDFIVGTSSPRRIVNLESTLADFLPSEKKLNIKTKMLRGNVNTRIGKLHTQDYDAIVLALPGIERLAQTPGSHEELTKLLDGLDYMILPQSEFPSAASQGALAIEYNEARKDNGELLEKLKRVECQNTKNEIIRERQAFNQYGGGCHLAVGINVFKSGDYYLHTHKGISDKKEIQETLLEGSFPSPESKGKNIFIGLPNDKLKSLEVSEVIFGDSYITKESIVELDPKVSSQSKHLYVASSYCIPLLEKLPNYSSLFSAGVKSMKALAKKGYFVNATSDSKGDDYLLTILASKALQIIHKNKENESLVLTHAHSSSQIGEVVPAYSRSKNTNTDLDLLKAKLKDTQVFFWTSFLQYESYVELDPSIKEKFHCCGLGKTHKLFTQNNLSVRPFSSINEFLSFTHKL